MPADTDINKKDEKPRRTFRLFDKNNKELGHGTYYPHERNAQVYMASANYASWQIADLGQALLYKDVNDFRWD